MRSMFSRLSRATTFALALGAGSLAVPAFAAGGHLLQQPVATQAGAQAHAKASQASVSGCLQESGGKYVVTSSSGAKYLLEAGPGINLRADVGHTVTVTGTVSMASTSGSASAGQRTLKVTDVKSIGSACKS